MKIELNERNAKILAATPNRELHGEDPKPYCAIRLQVPLSPDDLAMFHPNLRQTLFMNNDMPGADLSEQGKDDTLLRFPQMQSPFGWDAEMHGGMLNIHYGTTEKSHIKLPGIAVSKLSLEPMEGGVVMMRCSVISHPDEKQMGRLGMMVGTELPITITPPSDNVDAPPADVLAGD